MRSGGDSVCAQMPLTIRLNSTRLRPVLENSQVPRHGMMLAR